MRSNKSVVCSNKGNQLPLAAAVYTARDQLSGQCGEVLIVRAEEIFYKVSSRQSHDSKNSTVKTLRGSTTVWYGLMTLMMSYRASNSTQHARGGATGGHSHQMQRPSPTPQQLVPPTSRTRLVRSFCWNGNCV